MIIIKNRFDKSVLYQSNTATEMRAAVIEAVKESADLSGADLSGTYLNRADLSGADLSWTDLSRAYLSGADLSGANLSGTDLSRADLSGADLSGANLDCASWPLWCKSITAKVDEKIFIQLLYHALAGCPDKSPAREMITPELVDYVNKNFHHPECGKLWQK